MTTRLLNVQRTSILGDSSLFTIQQPESSPQEVSNIFNSSRDFPLLRKRAKVLSMSYGIIHDPIDADRFYHFPLTLSTYAVT